MSSHRVLVGLTAERALPCGRLLELSHGSGPVRAVMRPRPVAGPCTTLKSCRLSPVPLLLLRRPFHTSRLALDANRRRQPRTFTVSPPQGPTTRPPSPSPPPSSSSSSSSTTTLSISPTPLPLPEQFRTAMRLLTHPAVVLTATDTTTSSASSFPSPSSDSNTNTNNNHHPHPHRQRDPPTGIPRAMTMSSLTSLALRPTPVVTCNIAVPSRTFDAVASSGRFNVHVLADDAAGARVADWFADGAGTGGNAGSATATANSAVAGGRGSVTGENKGDGSGDAAAAALEGREVFESLTGDGSGVRVVFDSTSQQGTEPPLLQGDGVLYVLRCRLLQGEDGPPAQGWVRVRDHVVVLGEVVEIVEGSSMRRESEDRFGLLYADRHYRQLGNCITPVDMGEGEREIDE